MDSAYYAAMSDPSLNPQFSRVWGDEPPDKRRKGARQGALSENKTSSNFDNLSDQVGRLQAQWGIA